MPTWIRTLVRAVGAVGMVLYVGFALLFAVSGFVYFSSDIGLGAAIVAFIAGGAAVLVAPLVPVSSCSWERASGPRGPAGVGGISPSSFH